MKHVLGDQLRPNFLCDVRKERERPSYEIDVRIFPIVHTRVLSLMVFVVLQHSSLSLLVSLSSRQSEMRPTECEQQTLIIIAWSHSWNMVHKIYSFQKFYEFNGTIDAKWVDAVTWFVEREEFQQQIQKEGSWIWPILDYFHSWTQSQLKCSFGMFWIASILHKSLKFYAIKSLKSCTCKMMAIKTLTSTVFIRLISIE